MPSFKLLILFYSLSCLNPASGAVNLCQICHPSDITLAQGTVSPQTSGYTTNSNGCQSMNIACDKPNVAGVYMTMSFNKGQHVHLHNTTQPGGSIQFGLTCQSDGTWMNSQGEKVSEAACNMVVPTTTPAAPTAKSTEAATTTTKKSRTTTQEPCDDSDNDSSDSDASSDDNDDGCGCKRHKHHSGSDESNGDSDDGCECPHKRRHKHRRRHRHHHKRHCPCRSDSGSSETEEPTRETTKTSSTTTALPSSTTTQQITSTSSSTTSSTSPTTTTTGKDIFAIPSELRSSQQQCSIKALQAFQNGQTRQDFCSQNPLCFDLC